MPQAPQTPCSQPMWGPVRRKTWRSTSARCCRGKTSACTETPFNVKAITARSLASTGVGSPVDRLFIHHPLKDSCDQGARLPAFGVTTPLQIIHRLHFSGGCGSHLLDQGGTPRLTDGNLGRLDAEQRPDLGS